MLSAAHEETTDESTAANELYLGHGGGAECGSHVVDLCKMTESVQDCDRIGAKGARGESTVRDQDNVLFPVRWFSVCSDPPEYAAQWSSRCLDWDRGALPARRRPLHAVVGSPLQHPSRQRILATIIGRFIKHSTMFCWQFLPVL